MPYIIIICIAILSITFTSPKSTLNLPNTIENKPISVTGHIASLPLNNQNGTHFHLQLETLANHHSNACVLLSMKDNLILHPGDKVNLLVKLKNIHGLHNPIGFNQEQWALEKHLQATGTVITHPNNKVLSSTVLRYPLESLRFYFYNHLLRQLPQSPSSPWLLALTVGERALVNPADWEVLNKTGTNHLMAIAGLHIGMLAAMVYFLVSTLWRKSSWLCLCLPVGIAASIFSFMASISYSLLSGLSLPAMRAVSMLVVFIMARLLRRKVNAWHCFSIAMLSVLLLHPYSVLSDSFWLSFGTIALIIYGMGGRLAPNGLWWRYGRVQWVIAVGIVPLSLWFFQSSSLLSLIANSIAIPWLEFLILPFCLIAVLSCPFMPSLTAGLLATADQTLGWLWRILSTLAALPFSSWCYTVPNSWMLLMLVLGVLLLLLPYGMPGRWLGLLWLLPLLTYQVERPDRGHARLTMCDVGQGLALVLETHAHVLVFDAGPKLSDQSDMGLRVVLPYLRSRQLSHIDLLVVSHGDNDHIGGAGALLANMKVDEIKTSVPFLFNHKVVSPCYAGEHWQWDGVTFEFLHPAARDHFLGNNASCVLKISNGHAILMTGDIEQVAEKVLLDRYGAKLKSTILIAPHHGSATSSHPEWMKAVSPDAILISSGYLNRYHLPHPRIVQAYLASGATVLNTSSHGAVTLTL